jgi:non-ribosomal peptide synthetase component F
VPQRRHRVPGGDGYTGFQRVLAAWALVLGAATGRQTPVVAVPLSRRTEFDRAEDVGYFSNTVLVPVAVPRDGPMDGLLDACRHAMLAALAHPSGSLGAILRGLGVPGDEPVNPIAPTVLVQQQPPFVRRSPSGALAATVDANPVPTGSLGFALTLHTTAATRSLLLDYDDAHVHGATAGALTPAVATAYDAVLAGRPVDVARRELAIDAVRLFEGAPVP